jgi:hypothetical protein
MAFYVGRRDKEPEMSTMIETVYTAYALTSRGREEIECYETLQEALQDVLELWPEDDDGDVVIEDQDDNPWFYMARSEKDPAIVHIYSLRAGPRSVESYRCHYEPALGGSVRTIIKKLG